MGGGILNWWVTESVWILQQADNPLEEACMSDAQSCVPVGNGAR